METFKRNIRVERKDINFIQSVVESYDGMAVVRTLDPIEAIIELRISPGCESMISELIESLIKDDKLKILIDKDF